MHAIGLSRNEGPTPLRALGSSLTWLFLLVGGAWAIASALSRAVH